MFHYLKLIKIEHTFKFNFTLYSNNIIIILYFFMHHMSLRLVYIISKI